MEPKLFPFSCCPDPLWVRGGLCANPDCECGDVFIDLLEYDKSCPSGEGRLKLTLRIDTATWQELEAPPRSEALNALAQEFLREYPAKERAAWQAEVAEKRRIVRRLRECRLDPRDVETGKLVAFREVVIEPGSLVPSSLLFLFQFEHAGIKYLMDDFYCSNPDCHCGDVHLTFFGFTGAPVASGKAVIKECFQVVLSLEGRVQSVDCPPAMRAQATAVLKAWRKSPEFEHRLESFLWRYAKIKEIAARSLPTRARLRPSIDRLSPAAEQESEPPRVGRNEPCPCGSGKKYKKCCGKPGSFAPPG
jgi:hypothetical protein